MIQVEHITVTPVRVPLAQTVYAPGKAFRHRDYLPVDVRCTDGSWGIGFSYVGTGGGRAAASAAQELLVPEALGQDPPTMPGLGFSFDPDAVKAFAPT